MIEVWKSSCSYLHNSLLDSSKLNTSASRYLHHLLNSYGILHFISSCNHTKWWPVKMQSIGYTTAVSQETENSTFKEQSNEIICVHFVTYLLPLLPHAISSLSEVSACFQGAFIAFDFQVRISFHYHAHWY